MTRPQIAALTGVRGVAAWWVVLYHIRVGLGATLPSWVMAVFAKGYLAVDLFFVLSGFVLWLTWAQKFGEGTTAVSLDFLRKRIARVWPLHAVVLAATVVFALALQSSGRPLPPNYSWRELPLHLLLMQNWGFTDRLGWNDPSWSISTEMAAYLLFAILAPCRARLSRPVARVLAIVAPLALIIALDRAFAWQGSARLGADITHLGLARCLAEFGCGVAMCALWQRESSARLVALTTIVATTAIALDAWGLIRETLAIPLAFTALVPLLAATSSWRHNPLSSRLAVILGEISYSTYLSHFLLWTLFKIAFVRDANAFPLWAGALFLALTLVASFALHRWVELPGRSLLSGNRVAARQLAGDDRIYRPGNARHHARKNWRTLGLF